MVEINCFFVVSPVQPKADQNPPEAGPPQEDPVEARLAGRAGLA